MDENIKKADKKLLEIVRDNLIKNRFDSMIFETIVDAKRYIVDLIGSGKTVGIGGSVSFRESGILDEISKTNTVFTHKPEMNIEERRRIWIKSIDSDYYLASPQAITLDGKMIFVDGTGNRCAAITWGPRNLILLAGRNKIVKDFDEALWRSRNISAVRNNIRLSKKNPCVERGLCVDCSSEERICNIITVLLKKPKIANIYVFLVNEDLGY